MKTLWTYDLKGARSVTQRSPIASQGQIIVTMNHGQENRQGSISALCLESGKVNWRYDRPHVFSQPVIANDGSVLATGFDGVAHKIGLDGQLRWSVGVSERNLWSGLLEAGKFFFSEIGGGSDSTWALDAGTGEIDWRYKNGGHSYGMTVDRAKSIIVSSAAGSMDKVVYSLHSVDITSGLKNWTTAYRQILFRPTVYRNWIIVGSRGRIAAFDLADGSLASDIEIGEGADFRYSVFSCNDQFFLATDQGHIVALNMEHSRGFFGRGKISLSLVWQVHLRSPIEFFGMDDGLLTCVTKTGDLHLIDPNDRSRTENVKLPRFNSGMGVTRVADQGFVMAVNRSCSRVEL